MFDRWKISYKLLSGFAVILTLLACVSLFNIFSSRKIETEILRVKDESYQQSLQAIAISNLAEKILVNLRYAAASANHEPMDEAVKLKSELDRDFAELRRHLESDPEFAQSLSALIKAFEQCYGVGVQMVKFAVEQDFLEYVPAREKFTELTEAFEVGTVAFRERTSRNLYNSLEKVNELSRDSRRLSSWLALAGMLLSIGLALLIARHIAVPMRQAVDMLRNLGEGRLDKRLGLRRGDEIGQLAAAMDEMADKLGAMVHRLGLSTGELTEVSKKIALAAIDVDEGIQIQARGVEETSSAVTQISAAVRGVGQGIDHLTASANESTSSALEMAASIEEVAGNTEKLATSVAEVTSSVSELAATIRQLAASAEVLRLSSETTASSVVEMEASIEEVEQNARETSHITAEVRQDVEAGRQAVEATTSGMNEIRAAAKLVSGSVTDLSEKAKNIHTILSVIEEITDQTSLLALNAAIISAQAGEAGKGFAVVASEIRELAERTSSSTQQISAVIQSVQEETQRAVAAIARAEKSVAEGEQLSHQSGKVLGKIVSGTERVAQRMEHIARATGEQSKGSRRIRESMEQVAQMVNQIATATIEQGKGAELIQAAAIRMNELTGQVQTSTREQSHGSKVIAYSMEKVDGLVRNIKQACDEQERGSEQIQHATEEIRGSSEANLRSVGLLNTVVEQLAGQIAVLQQEMAMFEVDTAGIGAGGEGDSAPVSA